MRAQFDALRTGLSSRANVRRRTRADFQLERFKQVHAGLDTRYVLNAGQIQHFLRDVDLGQSSAGIHHCLQGRGQLEFSAFGMWRQCS